MCVLAAASSARVEGGIRPYYCTAAMCLVIAWWGEVKQERIVKQLKDNDEVDFLNIYCCRLFVFFFWWVSRPIIPANEMLFLSSYGLVGASTLPIFSRYHFGGFQVPDLCAMYLYRHATMTKTQDMQAVPANHLPAMRIGRARTTKRPAIQLRELRPVQRQSRGGGPSVKPATSVWTGLPPKRKVALCQRRPKRGSSTPVRTSALKNWREEKLTSSWNRVNSLPQRMLHVLNVSH